MSLQDERKIFWVECLAASSGDTRITTDPNRPPLVAHTSTCTQYGILYLMWCKYVLRGIVLVNFMVRLTLIRYAAVAVPSAFPSFTDSTFILDSPPPTTSKGEHALLSSARVCTLPITCRPTKAISSVYLERINDEHADAPNQHLEESFRFQPYNTTYNIQPYMRTRRKEQ